MKFYFIIILICLLGCSPKDELKRKTIEINIKEKVKEDLPKLTIKSATKLETNDSSLFGDISTVEYYLDRVYLLDMFSSKSVLAFSDKGGFVNKTKLGKGPDELINPFALFVDRKEQNVLVWDQVLMTIFKFDLDLNFLSKEKYEGVPLIEFSKIDKNKTLVRSHYNQDYAFTLYEGNTKSYKNQFVKDFKYSGGQGLFRSISLGDRVLLISSFDYNIYEYLNEKVHSLYYLDFGKYKITNKDIAEKGVQGIWNLISSGKKVSAPNEIAQSKNYLLFHVYFRSEPVYYIYSIYNEKVYRLNDYFDEGILPKCKVKGTLNDDQFYALVEPKDMIEFQKKHNTKLVNYKINLQDNPYIITFRLDKKNN